MCFGRWLCYVWKSHLWKFDLGFSLGQACTVSNPRLRTATGFQCFLHKHCTEFTAFHCLRCFHEQNKATTKKHLAAQDNSGKYWCSCSEVLLISACLTTRLVPKRLSPSGRWLSCSRTHLGKPPGEAAPRKLGPGSCFSSLTPFLSYFPYNCFQGRWW